MIEFALSMLFLGPIAYGTLHYGYGLYLRNVISNAARAAARYASMQPLDATKMDQFKSAVKNMAACGDPEGCSPSQCIAKSLTPDRFEVRIAFERNVPVEIGVRLSGLMEQTPGLPQRMPEVAYPFLGYWTP